MSLSRILCLPGLFSIERPSVATILLSLVLVIGMVCLPRLQFEDDITNSFLSDSPHHRNYQELVATLTFVPRQVVVLVQSDQPFDLDDYQQLRDISFELELADEVGFVSSLASATFPPDHPRYPNAPLLPLDLDLAEVESRLHAFAKAGQKVPVSVDRKAALIVVSFNAFLDESDFYAAVNRLKSAVQQQADPGLRLTFTGEALIGPDMIAALQRDLVLNTLVGSVLALAMATLFLRQFRLVLIAVLPTAAATFISLLAFTVLGFPVTVLNTVVPILVIVLALADSLHLTLHFRDGESDRAVSAQVRDTVMTVGPACALTSITTAVAFAAIGTTGNYQLREFAIVGAVSMLLTYLAVIVTFVLLAGRLGRSVNDGTQRTLLDIPARLARWPLDHAKQIYILCAVLVLVVVVGLSALRPWFNLDENLPTNSAVRIANQIIAREFGGIFRIWTELDVSGTQTLDDTPGWNRLVMLTETIEAAAPDYPVVSHSTLSRWHGQPNKKLSSDQLEQFSQALLAQLHSEEAEIARVITITPEAMLNEAALQIQTRIEADAHSAGATRSIGLPIIMRHEAGAIISQLSVGLVFACILSVAIITIFYRMPWLMPVLILPNMLPLAVSASSLALINGGQLTPTAMLALTVAFGIALDDSIHLINRYLAEKRNGHPVRQALEESIQKTGRAMLMTTVLICIGLLSTMLSSFETIRLFGGMLILTFIFAFFADILLLPCLLRAIARDP